MKPDLHSEALSRLELLPADDEATLYLRCLVEADRLRGSYNAHFAYEGGSSWWVGLYGAPRRIGTKLAGMRHIQFLLQHPRQDIPAVQVYHSGRATKDDLDSLWHANERCRVNLTQQIYRALQLLANEEQGNPPVAAHLRSYLHCGSYFFYRPDPEDNIAWTFK